MSKTCLSKIYHHTVSVNPSGEGPLRRGLFDVIKVTGSTRDKSVIVQVAIPGGTTHSVDMLCGDLIEGPFISARFMLGAPGASLQGLIYERSTIEED